MWSYFASHLAAIFALLFGSAFFAGAETSLFSLSRVSRISPRAGGGAF